MNSQKEKDIISPLNSDLMKSVNTKVKRVFISPQNPDIYSPTIIKKERIIVSPKNPDIYSPIDYFMDKPFVSPQNPDVYQPVYESRKNNESLELPKLTHLMLEITRQCSFKCKHCYCNANNQNFEQLSFEDIIKLIEQFSQQKGKSITLTGGEPKMHPEFWKIMELLHYYEIEISIFTNGYFWNEDDLVRAKSLGLCSIQVSVDGIEDTHDNFRCFKGSYLKAIETVKLSVKQKINTVMMITIHNDNYTEIPELLAYTSTLKLNGINLNTYIPQGRAKRLPEFDIRELRNIYKNVEFNVCSNGSTTSCGIGFKKIAVLANGNIVPCEVIYDQVLGNIYEDDVFDVFYHSEIMNDIRKATVNQIDSCKNCKAKDLCKGGCKASAWLKNHSYFTPDYRQCEIWKRND